VSDARRVWVCSDFSTLRGMTGTVVHILKDLSVLVVLDGLPDSMRFFNNELQHIV
jgi:hypothetical protein